MKAILTPNRFSLFFICLAAGILFTHCDALQRYDEGPFISFYSVKDRIVNTWSWAYLEENNQNLSGIYQDSTIVFQNDGEVRICGGENCRTGNWDLIFKKRQLQIIFGRQAHAYDIKLLKKKEMWLSIVDSTANYYTEWQLIPAD